MKLESLKIEPERSYAATGPDNPYKATLRVEYNKNTMQVKLSDDVCRRILLLAGDEIAKAAQIQIDDFVKTAIAVSSAPAIEGKVND